MKKRVVFRAPLLTQSGYGQHARGVARWLLKRDDFDVKFQPTPWGHTTWLLDRDRCGGLVGAIIDRSIPFSDKGFDASFQLLLPNEWDKGLAKFNVGMTAGIETDRCNPAWITAANSMDMLIVPSKHALTSMNPSALTVKHRVVPESYDDCFEKPASVELPEFSTSFNFLIFGQLTAVNAHADRKNTFFALKWLFEEFENDRDVGIVIKTNLGKNTLIDRNNVVDVMTKLISETRKGSNPRLHLLHGDMHEGEVAALLKHPQVKALVAPTRGEGFGLPLLEAAVSGLPVIATGWSGHLDFMLKGRFIELYYDLVDVDQTKIDDQMFMKGARWANVSERDFKKKVRKFRESSSMPREWAKDLSEKLKLSHSFEAIAREYDTAIAGVIP